MLFFILVASCAYLADAFPGGAPDTACNNLTPSHGGNAAQTSEVPFVIDVTQFDDGSGTLVYTPGRTYILTLADPNGAQTFRGFFVQSRLEADDTTRVGVFAVNGSNSRLSSCPTNTDGITHVQETPRIEFGSMTMQWTAPAAGTGPIRFAYAVVQVFGTFWANQRSDIIEEAVEPEPVPTSTSLVSTTESPSIAETRTTFVASAPTTTSVTSFVTSAPTTTSVTSFVTSTPTATSSTPTATSSTPTATSSSPTPTPGEDSTATATALTVSLLSLLASGVGAVLLL